MDNTDALIQTLSKTMLNAATAVVGNAKFDRSTVGSVISKNGDHYTVLAFGGTYSIKSTQNYEVNQRVVVTACQNDFKKLVMRPL